MLFRGTKVTTVRDREILFNKLHRLRLSDAVQQDCVKLFASVFADSLKVLRFIQALLLERVSEIFKGQLRLEKEQSNVVRQQISKKDLKKFALHIGLYRAPYTEELASRDIRKREGHKR